MAKNNQRQLFFRESSSWRVPALFGLIIFSFSIILKFHFYYLHYYLIIASAISLLVSYRKYVSLSDTSIEIYFGLFSNKIRIYFENIQCIEFESTEVKSFARVGPMGAVPYNFEIDHISINLFEPMETKQKETISSKKGKNLFHRTIDVTQDGKKIIFYKPPRDGFRPLLNKLSRIANVLNADKVSYERRFADIKSAIFTVSLFAGFIILSFVAMYQS